MQKISPTSILKSDSTIYALPAILEILATLIGYICGNVSFQYSYRCVDFPGIYQNFQNSSFSKHPLKNGWNDFFRSV